MVQGTRYKILMQGTWYLARCSNVMSYQSLDCFDRDQVINSLEKKSYQYADLLMETRSLQKNTYVSELTCLIGTRSTSKSKYINILACRLGSGLSKSKYINMLTFWWGPGPDIGLVWRAEPPSRNRLKVELACARTVIMEPLAYLETHGQQKLAAKANVGANINSNTSPPSIPVPKPG